MKILNNDELTKARTIINSLIAAKTVSDIEGVFVIEEELLNLIESNHGLDLTTDNPIYDYSPDLDSAIVSLGEAISFKNSYIRYGESEDDYYPYLTDFINFIDKDSKKIGA